MDTPALHRAVVQGQAVDIACLEAMPRAVTTPYMHNSCRRISQNNRNPGIANDIGGQQVAFGQSIGKRRFPAIGLAEDDDPWRLLQPPLEPFQEVQRPATAVGYVIQLGELLTHEPQASEKILRRHGLRHGHGSERRLHCHSTSAT